jgi:hypothetical protein
MIRRCLAKGLACRLKSVCWLGFSSISSSVIFKILKSLIQKRFLHNLIKYFQHWLGEGVAHSQLFILSAVPLGKTCILHYVIASYVFLHCPLRKMFILYSVFCILYSVFFCILYSVFCILYCIHYSVFCVLYSVFCILYFVLCTVFCIMYSVFCILYSVSIFYILYYYVFFILFFCVFLYSVYSVVCSL